MKSYLDDDDLDDEVPPGGSVRVPLYLTDSDARDHQPHFVRAVTDAAVRDARAAARDARDQMIERATNAWRMAGRVQSKQDADPTKPDPSAANVAEEELERWQGRDLSDLARAVEARRRAVHAEFSQRLSNAWRLSHY
jgi:hypothetical protein